ncbi:MAG: hypothetical protein KDH96_01955 [Candidatus Riesia sp.]|nr:hypothetical protein [Candidatus Riesia sp.]
MNPIHYIITERPDFTSLTVFLDGKMQAFQSDTHPQLDKALKALRDKDWSLAKDLLASPLEAARKLCRLSSAVEIKGNELFFLGKVLAGPLADKIRETFYAKKAVMPLVNFLEKVNANPSVESRNQLYEFAIRNNFEITPRGDLIAYKGVTPELTSVNSGRAFVNGIEHNGQIPNQVGSVVTMPRADVNPNRDEGCSHGLHVGSYEYASDFASVLMKVEVNPKDVVSVPRDCSWQKMRVCEYVVLDFEETSTFHFNGSNDYDDDDENLEFTPSYWDEGDDEDTEE